jgi:hypothetical protein
MSFDNPTRLRIGMHGEFAGKDFRVIGRVVMGVEVEGENYFWSEFNLESKSGERATLVFDESEGSGTWRLFTEFTPEYAMTAADAVLKQVGDVINLTGEDVRVTWVGSSRVHRIEGIPPKNLKVGDEDHYFNAELRDTMLVVSWMGRNVEFYQGITLTSQAVASAFRLTGVGSSARRLPHQFTGMRLDGDSADSESDTGNGQWIVQVAVLAVVAIFLIGQNFSWQSSYEAAPVKKFSAPPLPLAVGGEGRLHGKPLRVSAHAVVEIAEQGSVFERHEYTLLDESNQPALLVCGDVPDAKSWTIYTPLPTLPPPAPQMAAAKKFGDTVSVEGQTATITDLFQSTVLRADALETNSFHAGEVNFGHSGTAGARMFFARWDATGAQLYLGEKVTPKEIQSAFTLPAGR